MASGGCLADRTQAPSGAGYAWENRTVVSRFSPRQSVTATSSAWAAFSGRQREMLFHLAPAGRSHPTIVFLTPGPQNETYFEHAYLGRHLGFSTH